MDEPFSAVDPIVRKSLQEEFLRLQSELEKTIAFVTHDIDEAVKLGHRIAVFQVGGVLAQYAAPDDLLANPAEGFVTEFLGGDKGLRRLRFNRELDAELDIVSDIESGAEGEPRPGGGPPAGEETEAAER
jgi:osmoprotectant transport system ATP-binding protein